MQLLQRTLQRGALDKLLRRHVQQLAAARQRLKGLETSAQTVSGNAQTTTCSCVPKTCPGEGDSFRQKPAAAGHMRGTRTEGSLPALQCTHLLVETMMRDVLRQEISQLITARPLLASCSPHLGCFLNSSLSTLLASVLVCWELRKVVGTPPLGSWHSAMTCKYQRGTI